MNFDQSMYVIIFDAAHQILRNNLNQIPQEFADGFMMEHDLRNGASSQRGVEQLYRYVADTAVRLNNGNATIRDNDQLFQIVGDYIKAIYDNWARRRSGGGGGTWRQQTGGFGANGGGGGFSQPNNGFGGNSGGGFGFNQTRPQAGSHLIDDGIRTQQSQQPSVQQQQPVSFTQPLVRQESLTMTDYSFNPLDDVSANEVSFSTVPESAGWGMQNPKDRSIVMMSKVSLKTRDEKVVIRVCDGFERTYYNNPFSVAKDFFRVAPDSFLAESFIFRVFYNHVEVIDIPTAEFLEVRRKFISALDRDRVTSVYNVIITILNEMLYGPRTALANYLVSHINRALFLSCGMAENPALRIKFTAIEDLEELLGTNFQSKLLEVPNAREIIENIVNTAILNSFTTYSDAMFASPHDKAIDVMRTSEVFDYAIPGVYPNKTLIPSSESPEAELFFNALQDKVLSQKTYVRSIRSVIITNILGGRALSVIGDKPSAISGQIPGLLNEYILAHQQRLKIDNKCDLYDDVIRGKKTTADKYRSYHDAAEQYELNILSDYADREIPTLPVDQTIFAIQFKKNPADYLGVFDVVTTMNSPRDRNQVIMAKKKINVIKPTT